MPFNGSGIWAWTYNWVNDAANGIPITASRMDGQFNDAGNNGFDNCLTRDGQGIATANLPMGGFKHTGVAAGTALTDYADVASVQNAKFNWVASAGTVDAITAAYSPAIASLVDGQLCYFRATGANAITTPTFAPSGLTAHTIVKQGGSALVAGDIPANLAECLVRYNLANTRWELLNPAKAYGATTGSGSVVLASSIPNYISGLTLSTAGSSATFSVSAGSAMDSANVAAMVLAASISKTTSAWAVGTGNGALDTGSIAINTWYTAYEIQRSDTGVTDALVSLSASAPTMPTNYDRKRRIGSMKTNGSSQWTKFSQFGDEFLWDVFVQDATSVVPGVTTASSVTLTVPTGAQVGALFSALLNDSSGGPALLISPLDVSDQAAASAGALSLYDNAATGAALPPVRTNTSAQVRVRVNSNTASYWINTRGWIDTRGK